uniref:Secreted protein n=1 Tax=Cacopsylla melanoneura TaxID=428564 RepID=A0A8D8Y8Y5_9HEMI
MCLGGRKSEPHRRSLCLVTLVVIVRRTNTAAATVALIITPGSVRIKISPPTIPGPKRTTTNIPGIVSSPIVNIIHIPVIVTIVDIPGTIISHSTTHNESTTIDVSRQRRRV